MASTATIIIQAVDKVTAVINDMANKGKVAMDKLKTAFNAIGDMGQKLTMVGAAGTAAFGLIVNEAAKFEGALKNTMTMTGLQGQALADMEKQMGAYAMSLSEKFGIAGEQVNTAFYQVLSSGAEIGSEQFKALSEAALKLNKVVGIDMSAAVEQTSDSLHAFGMDVSQAGKMADVFFKSSMLGATTVPQLMEAMKTAAPAAKLMGISLEETSAVLTLWASKGTKAGEAGMAFRQVLLRLVKPTKEAQDALDQMGVKIYDANHNFRGIVPVLTDMQNGLKNMNKEQADAALKAIAGQHAFSRFAALLQTDMSTITDWTAQLQNAGGALDEAFGNKMKGFGEQVKVLLERLKGLAVVIGNQLLPVLTPVVTKISDVVSGIIKWVEKNPQIAKTLTILMGLGSVLATMAGTFMIVVAAVGTFITSLISSVTAVAGAVTALGGMSVVLGAIGAALPVIGLAVVALGGAISTLISIFQYWHTAGTIVRDVLNWLNKYLGWIVIGLGEAVKAIAPFVIEIYKIGTAITDIVTMKFWWKNLIPPSNEEFMNKLAPPVDTIGPMWQSLVQTISSSVDTIQTKISSFDLGTTFQIGFQQATDFIADWGENTKKWFAESQTASNQFASAFMTNFNKAQGILEQYNKKQEEAKTYNAEYQKSLQDIANIKNIINGYDEDANFLLEKKNKFTEIANTAHQKTIEILSQFGLGADIFDEKQRQSILTQDEVAKALEKSGIKTEDYRKAMSVSLGDIDLFKQALKDQGVSQDKINKLFSDANPIMQEMFDKIKDGAQAYKDEQKAIADGKKAEAEHLLAKQNLAAAQKELADMEKESTTWKKKYDDAIAGSKKLMDDYEKVVSGQANAHKDLNGALEKAKIPFADFLKATQESGGDLKKFADLMKKGGYTETQLLNLFKNLDLYKLKVQDVIKELQNLAAAQNNAGGSGGGGTGTGTTSTAGGGNKLNTTATFSRSVSPAILSSNVSNNSAITINLGTLIGDDSSLRNLSTKLTKFQLETAGRMA